MYLERSESKQPWTDSIVDTAEEKHKTFVILASLCVRKEL